MSVHVHSEPVQQFSASFELRGSPEAGELIFTSLLGITLAQLRWDVLGATLYTSGASQPFESFDALTQYIVGTSLPVGDLFEWLHGNAKATSGWQVDLTDFQAGRMSARRLLPEPAADLQLVLER
jgi:outer membrane lipoprotein LolB